MNTEYGVRSIVIKETLKEIIYAYMGDTEYIIMRSGQDLPRGVQDRQVYSPFSFKVLHA